MAIFESFEEPFHFVGYIKIVLGILAFNLDWLGGRSVHYHIMAPAYKVVFLSVLFLRFASLSVHGRYPKL